MSGKDFQEEAVLAAVKPLKTANSTMPETKKLVALGTTFDRRFDQPGKPFSTTS